MFEHVVSKRLRLDFDFDLSCSLKIWFSRDEDKFETYKKFHNIKSSCSKNHEKFQNLKSLELIMKQLLYFSRHENPQGLNMRCQKSCVVILILIYHVVSRSGSVEMKINSRHIKSFEIQNHHILKIIRTNHEIIVIFFKTLELIMKSF